LTLQWFLTLLTGIVALLALGRARRLSKRLERLAESYWELRYEYGQLSAKLSRLEGGAPPDAPKAAEPTGFVPLSSLKSRSS